MGGGRVFFCCCLNGGAFVWAVGRFFCLLFVRWAGSVFFCFAASSGDVFSSCCLGGGRFIFCCLGGAFFFAVWAVSFFFAVWAGVSFYFFFIYGCWGGEREFTHLPACLARC